MNRLTLILCSGVMLMACNDQVKVKVAAAAAPTNTDLIRQNLKGRVQTMEETTWAVDESGKSEQDSLIYTSLFNEKGYQDQYITRDPAGRTREEQRFTHYDGGQSKEFVTMKESRQISKWLISIDSNGKYSGAEVYDSTGRLSSYWKDISENENGEVLTGTEYHPDNTLKSSFISNYSGPHFMGSTTKDSVGKETSRSYYKLNEKGDPAESNTVTITKDSTKTERLVYKYDAYDQQGNWTQRTSYDEKGRPVKTVRRKFTYYKN